MDGQQMVESSSEEDIFSAALALPITERERYLERVCGEDSGLLGRLRTLLDATADASSFVRERSREMPAEAPGDRIDRYRLIRELGEGGCGVAYLAEQTTPVTRQVALKIIKPGMDTRAVIGRFEVERQALAVMDHPHIAKVFDAGVSPLGRPYFVMELVRGIKITDYCNQSRQTVAERISLFCQVCHAIQHAHHRGVIHRDIKPSNVLVTMHDGMGIAKVIDFGLVKAMQGSLTEESVHTTVEQFLGTPAYVSPEQAEPGQREVDTRSDIYSLGVLLYELLTGCTPFDAPGLLQSRADLVRRIREEEPRRPSKRLMDFEAGRSPIAPVLFGTTSAKLLKQLRGDLDWIVMRCLAKDRSRRYQHANDVSLDLERYLRHEAVTARPPTVSYTLWKFARRHQLIFAASLGVIAFVIFTVGFAITLSVQAARIAAERDRAEQERKHAERISNIVLGMFAAADPFENYGIEVTAPGLLDLAAREIKDELREQPEARAQLLEVLGRAYRRRGEATKAITYLNDAVRARREMGSAGDVARLSAMIELSIAQRLGGHLPIARETMAEATELARHLGLERSALYGKLLLNRARNEILTDNLSQARRDLQNSLDLNREFAGASSKEVADVFLTQSLLHQWTDDLSEAEASAREGVKIFESTVAPMHPDRVFAEVRLAEVLYLRDQIDLAEPIFLETLNKVRQLFGRNNWRVANVLDSLAKIRRSQGRLDEAETYAREAVTVHDNALGQEHPGSGYLRTSLAALLIQRKKFEDAETALRRALDFRSQAPPSDQYIASSEYLLGEVLLATGRVAEAEKVLTSSVERWKRSGAPPWRAARSASALGEVLHRQGRLQEAGKYLTDSNRKLMAASGAESDAKTMAQQRFARFAQATGEEAGVE